MAGREPILLQWMGVSPMNGDMLERVRQEVETAFTLPTNLVTVDAPLEDSLEPRRGQYSSTKILRWILASIPPGVAKVVGITDVDLFIPVLTFVFGEAQVDGRAAVVSTARLRLTYNEQPASPALVEARLLKECLHELGHTFGLVHCPGRDCLMSRSNSVLEVDQKRVVFCRDCRQRLRALEERNGS
ncbi:MAG TPA: archaemetzincin family Zn-dependent metalloprotease [archaeon]|nr:archaemetzincin family Zn-dependent metalloprotease [archaeon]